VPTQNDALALLRRAAAAECYRLHPQVRLELAADDLVGEMIVRLGADLSRIHCRAFARQLARNVCTDWQRKLLGQTPGGRLARQRYQSAAYGSSAIADADEGADDPSAPRVWQRVDPRTAEAALIAQQPALADRLRDLPTLERRALLLRTRGLPHRAVCEQLGLQRTSIGYSVALEHRGLRRLEGARIAERIAHRPRRPLALRSEPPDPRPPMLVHSAFSRYLDHAQLPALSLADRTLITAKAAGIPHREICAMLGKPERYIPVVPQRAKRIARKLEGLAVRARVRAAQRAAAREVLA